MSIEAMKQALEALYPISHNSTDDYRGQADKAITSLRQAVEEAEKQEPVAWLQIGVGLLHDGDVIARTTKPKKWNPEWWRFEPLYTHQQPKRAWVGLTDEDLSVCDEDGVILAHYWEAKLKEKNQ